MHRFALALLLSTAALAQEEPRISLPDVEVEAPPAELEPAHPVAHEVLNDVQPLLDVAQGKAVGTFAGVVAFLLVLSRMLVRFGKRLPGKAGEWMAHPVAAWALPVALSVLGALFTALAAGAQVTLGLLLGAVLAGMAAAGTGAKQAVIEQAVRKGEVARAAVTDKASAIAALQKPL